MYISGIWGAKAPGRIEPKIFLEEDIRDVITCFKFGDDRFRGSSSTEGQILPFTIDFDGRPVVHGNGVGRIRICLASFNSPTPKTPCYTQRSPGYLLYKPSYSRFCLKFRCHGNWGNPWVNLNDAMK